MAKQAKERDWSVEVTRVYGVVPRPRSSVKPEAWPKPKPKSWRTYYGYSRNCLNGGSFEGKFSEAAVAVAKAEHKGAMLPFEPSADEKRAAFVAEAVASVTHDRKPERKRTAAEVFAASEAVILRKPAPAAAPEPVREPEPVCAPEPAPAPNIAPAAPASDRLAIAAAVLRDLAAKYGPRRAHKLLAMADFVTAAAGIAA